MPVEIITKEDLYLFRMQLLDDLMRLFKPMDRPVELLKGNEVRKLLKISAGTLQNYRIRNILHGKRLPNSRTWYYSSEEVNKLKESLLNQN